MKTMKKYSIGGMYTAGKAAYKAGEKALGKKSGSFKKAIDAGIAKYNEVRIGQEIYKQAGMKAPKSIRPASIPKVKVSPASIKAGKAAAGAAAVGAAGYGLYKSKPAGSSSTPPAKKKAAPAPVKKAAPVPAKKTTPKKPSM